MIPSHHFPPQYRFQVLLTSSYLNLSMTASIISEAFANDGNNIPWDEEIDLPACALQDDGDKSWSSIDGAPSDQWRRLGQVRRRYLLDEDRRKGRLTFDLNMAYDVDRYFQVADRVSNLILGRERNIDDADVFLRLKSQALDQFHNIYRTGKSLEEAYVMGYRMVTFLTDCLPNHPGFHHPSASARRNQTFQQLEKLQAGLDDLALKIDEAQADSFAENFDPLSIVSADYGSDDEGISDDAVRNWIKLGGSFQQCPQKSQVESPATTIDTSGTISFEASDCSSSDDDLTEQQQSNHVHTNVVVQEGPAVMVELGTSFLEKIAAEEVKYESDSEATDSWAQCETKDDFGSNAHPTCQMDAIARAADKLNPASTINLSPTGESRSAMSGPRPDPPAHIARVPSSEQVVGEEFETSFVSEEKLEMEACEQNRPLSFRVTMLQHDQPGNDIFESREADIDRRASDASVAVGVERRTCRRHGVPRESAVLSEIEKFLDSSFEYDPGSVVESSMVLFPSRTVSNEQLLAGRRAAPAKRMDDTGWIHFD
jgi:hypothetical protein